ncbi:SatD family protein [Pedobacter montanisoli]|uniref:SatD family protein n=1 Tax=Pedobacter montanisoli TaxID=2923277 RepID=A0ABS9ZXU1_9SPHI|nr:SatD family protein [Pedobacter montanisoli]MCJ0743125.1 SatD family protein [Pedobacter montanisoli]
MKTQAVMTGDIINFTKLSPSKRKNLIRETEVLLKTWIKEKENAEIFRGDSYQVLFNDALEAITKSIQLICWFKKHSDEKNKVSLSTRISIGIGEVSYRGKNVLNSDGEAFHLSGRHFDTLKDDQFLAIHTNNIAKNNGIEIILNFINKYIGNWTIAQAEVIFLLLEGKTQQEIAETLSLSQPSVNSRLKSAGWKEFEPAIKYIANLVQ